MMISCKREVKAQEAEVLILFWEQFFDKWFEILQV